jgi:hypothetical protein
LIGLIITMVTIATLGAAMMALFSSSFMNQAYADLGRKAYCLAESGYRYAASRFLWAGTAGQNAAMTDLNNKTCNLSGNAGSFTTVIYPFWFNTNATAAGSTTLATTIYGTVPSEFSGSFSGGYIKVGTSYYSYSSGSGSGTTVTFSGLSPSLPATTAGVLVLPVAYPTSTSLSKGGSLTLSSTGSGALPLLNGNFTLNPAPTGGGVAGVSNGTVFNYTKRVGNILYNITLASSTQNTQWTSAMSGISTSTNVVLGQFLRLDSTGTIGGTSRKVTYNVPIGPLYGGGGFQKQQDTDNMANTGNWSVPSGSGSVGTASVSGDNAMQVTGTSSAPWWSGSSHWAIAFFTGYINTNLAQAWVDAGGFLSYDLQVKVYNTSPDFFAGMNFRAMNNSGNTDLYTYGVSFIKPRAIEYGFGFIFCAWGDPDHLSDDIDSNLVPGGVSGPLFDGSLEDSGGGCFIGGSRYVYGLPAIVFWKKTSAGFSWLAYRILTTADGIVTKSGDDWRLVNWSTLMARVSEGYSLTFTNGGGATGVPIKEGDTITTSATDSTNSARVVMTPILISGDWVTNKNAAGTLVLANPTGTFSSGNSLYVNGTQLATAGTYSTTKRNYIRVYFTRPTTIGTANTVETDNNRLANARGSVNWPPDDITEITAANDYVTLVNWTGTNSTGTEMAPALIAGNWTVGTGWTITSNQLRKTADGTGTAQPSTSLAIVAGTSYSVSITYSNRTTGSFSCTLGGVSVGTVSSGSSGTLTNTITATTTGNLIITPTNTSRFYITAVSVKPTYSTVPSTSEPNAIIVDNDLTSPSPACMSTNPFSCTTANFIGPNGTAYSGDSIALITSSVYATSTYYDDFAIQLDMNAGKGFLAPIQQ